MSGFRISVEITSPKQLAALVKASSKSGFLFLLAHGESSDAYYAGLYQSVEEHLLIPTCLSESVEKDVRVLRKMLQSQLSADNQNADLLEQVSTVEEFLRCVDGVKSVEQDEEYRQSTAHFREFCGPEWLTKKGLISKKLALAFVQNQMKTRGIMDSGGKIWLDEYFRNLFNTTAASIYTSEIPRYVEGFFCK